VHVTSLNLFPIVSLGRIYMNQVLYLGLSPCIPTVRIIWTVGARFPGALPMSLLLLDIVQAKES
jgi:hypothetical protein